MPCGRLVVLDRWGRDVKHYPLSKGLVMLGSDSACNIRFLQSSVGSHTIVVVGANQATITDVSESGTMVNERPVSVATLRHGDLITIGDRALRWEYNQPEAVRDTVTASHHTTQAALMNMSKALSPKITPQLLKIAKKTHLRAKKSSTSVSRTAVSTRSDTPSLNLEINSEMRRRLRGSAAESSIEDPRAKKGNHKNESIKFDLSNLDNYEEDLTDFTFVPNNYITTSVSDTNLNLHVSDTSAQNCTPTKSIRRKLFQTSLEPKHEKDNLVPESPSTRKSSRGYLMVQKLTQTPVKNTVSMSGENTTIISPPESPRVIKSERGSLERKKTSSRYSSNTMKSVSDKSATIWNMTKIFSPRLNPIFGLVSIDSNQSRSFETPEITSARKTRSTIGPTLPASSTPYDGIKKQSTISSCLSKSMPINFDKASLETKKRRTSLASNRSSSLSKIQYLSPIVDLLLGEAANKSHETIPVQSPIIFGTISPRLTAKKSWRTTLVSGYKTPQSQTQSPRISATTSSGISALNSPVLFKSARDSSANSTRISAAVFPKTRNSQNTNTLNTSSSLISEGLHTPNNIDSLQGSGTSIPSIQSLLDYKNMSLLSINTDTKGRTPLNCLWRSNSSIPNPFQSFSNHSEPSTLYFTALKTSADSVYQSANSHRTTISVQNDLTNISGVEHLFTKSPQNISQDVSLEEKKETTAPEETGQIKPPIPTENTRTTTSKKAMKPAAPMSTRPLRTNTWRKNKASDLRQKNLQKQRGTGTTRDIKNSGRKKIQKVEVSTALKEKVPATAKPLPTEHKPRNTPGPSTSKAESNETGPLRVMRADFAANNPIARRTRQENDEVKETLAFKSSDLNHLKTTSPEMKQTAPKYSLDVVSPKNKLEDISLENKSKSTTSEKTRQTKPPTTKKNTRTTTRTKRRTSLVIKQKTPAMNPAAPMSTRPQRTNTWRKNKASDLRQQITSKQISSKLTNYHRTKEARELPET